MGFFKKMTAFVKDPVGKIDNEINKVLKPSEAQKREGLYNSIKNPGQPDDKGYRVYTIEL
jgi:hypothetical protein